MDFGNPGRNQEAKRATDGNTHWRLTDRDTGSSLSESPIHDGTRVRRQRSLNRLIGAEDSVRDVWSIR